MTYQQSVAMRNGKLDGGTAVIGASPILKIRTGSPPANCAAADSGSVLATLLLPNPFMAAAAGGVVAKTGTWQDASADASGTPGHFRLYDSTGAVCHEQGTVTITGGGGDMTIDSATVTVGQVFTVTDYTKTAGNA